MNVSVEAFSPYQWRPPSRSMLLHHPAATDGARATGRTAASQTGTEASVKLLFPVRDASAFDWRQPLSQSPEPNTHQLGDVRAGWKETRGGWWQRVRSVPPSGAPSGTSEAFDTGCNQGCPTAVPSPPTAFSCRGRSRSWS